MKCLYRCYQSANRDTKLVNRGPTPRIEPTGLSRRQPCGSSMALELMARSNVRTRHSHVSPYSPEVGSPSVTFSSPSDSGHLQLCGPLWYEASWRGCLLYKWCLVCRIHWVPLSVGPTYLLHLCWPPVVDIHSAVNHSYQIAGPLSCVYLIWYLLPFVQQRCT